MSSLPAHRKVADAQAKSQEEIILAFFRERPWIGLTPHAVQEAVLPDAPITSVRRAITTLAYKDLLEKTEAMVAEKLGKPNYLWRLKVGDQLELF